jgi:hypothetical protein
MEQKNSSFSQLQLALMSPARGSVRAYFKELHMLSCFAKQFTEIVLAPRKTARRAKVKKRHQ